MTVFLRGDLEQPGQWAPATFGLKPTVKVSCPECGRVVTLLGHRIHSDGRVRPNFVCPRYHCNFHSEATLDGWRGADALEQDA